MDPSIPRDATPVGIQAALRALNDPANQARMREMARSPDMKAVEKDVVAGLLDGSLSALGDAERAKRIDALAGRYASVMLRGVSRETSAEMGPAIAGLLRSAVRSAIAEAARPENSVALTRAASRGITEDVGPAMERVIGDNVGPGIAAALETEEMHRALADTARLLGKELVLGVNEGMAQVEKKKSDGEQSPLAALAREGSHIASAVTWVLVGLVVVMGGLLWKLLMQARKYRTESAEQAAETRLLVARGR